MTERMNLEGLKASASRATHESQGREWPGGNVLVHSADILALIAEVEASRAENKRSLTAIDAFREELERMVQENDALRKAVRICPNCGPVEISHYCLGIPPIDATHSQEATDV